mgnify:CR=1 FL=1
MGRSATFAHEGVDHKWQRKNGDFVEQTGAHNFVLTYRIPMRDGLFEKLGYGQLFSERLQKLLDDCRDETPGELWDPVLGLLRCVPKSYRDDLEPTKRDGTDITLEFKHAPEREGEDVVVTPAAATNAAEAMAVEAASFEADAIEAEEISPNRSVELKELLQGLSNTGRAILAAPNDVRNEMNQIRFWAKDIEDIANEATSVDAIMTRHRARDTRDKANRVLDNSLLIRPVRTDITTTPRSVASLAAEYGVTFQEFLLANPSLGASPTVQVGTTVVIPDGG